MKEKKANSSKAKPRSIDWEKVRIRTYLYPFPRRYVLYLFAVALQANGEKVLLITP